MNEMFKEQLQNTSPLTDTSAIKSTYYDQTKPQRGDKYLFLIINNEITTACERHFQDLKTTYKYVDNVGCMPRFVRGVRKRELTSKL